MSRLQAICDIFPFSDFLVDIGSDHGHLGIKLLQEKKVSSVWNVEISKDALERSKESYFKKNLFEKAKFFISDGFKNLENFPKKSTVVCAGMGTIEILKILKHLPKNLLNLILCSHTNYFLIRDWSWKNNWKIVHEKYVCERGIVYIILWLQKINFSYFLNNQKINLTTDDLIFGEFKFWKKYFLLFKDYWISFSKKVLIIPEKYRSEIEIRILDFLKGNSILKS